MVDSSIAAPRPRLAIDAMGADSGADGVIEGIARAIKAGVDADVTLHGREGEIRTALASRDLDPDHVHIAHADDVITMTDKPSAALRRGKGSSMWSAIAAVKDGSADAAVSSGNTGALMAMSVFQLRMIEGIDRPAIAALWPTEDGSSVVLDVGANVEASTEQLVQFAIMGEAYYRALRGKDQPRVALLNVGAEELKGHGIIRSAAKTLQTAQPDMEFIGFVEGNDIATGVADVVVTDGFTGNIALKTAEGTARLVGGWVKTALQSSFRAKIGALMMMPALNALKAEMDPSRVNGAPLLGLNGLVIKSHGGADPDGVAAAIRRAARLARHPFRDEIARSAERVRNEAQTADETSTREEPPAAAE